MKSKLEKAFNAITLGGMFFTLSIFVCYAFYIAGCTGTYSDYKEALIVYVLCVITYMIGHHMFNSEPKRVIDELKKEENEKNKN